MATAFVLINSDLGSDEAIIAGIRGTLDEAGGVKYEVQGVYGVYDIVLKLEAEDPAVLRSVITGGIRRIPKVQSTLTMMMIEEQEGPTAPAAPPPPPSPPATPC